MRDFADRDGRAGQESLIVPGNDLPNVFYLRSME